MSGLDSPHSGADDAHATPGPKRGKGSSPRPVSVAPGAPAGGSGRWFGKLGQLATPAPWKFCGFLANWWPARGW